MRAQGCRVSRPQPVTPPKAADAKKNAPITGKIAWTNWGTSGGRKRAQDIASNTNPGINRKADAASHRIPNKRTCPAIRPCLGRIVLGANGIAPVVLPQFEQKRE